MRKPAAEPTTPQVVEAPPREAGVRDGVVRALPLLPALAGVGLLFGAEAARVGLSIPAAAALSGVVFAGGAQFAALGLLAAGGSLAAVVGLVAVVNARYVLLSTATLELAREATPTRGQRLALALGVVDESFALQAAWRRGGVVDARGLLGIPLALWATWVASTAAGAWLGGALPDVAALGLDYALPGIFVGLLGIFADRRSRLLGGIAALGLGGALAVAGQAVVAMLLLPLVLSFALGRWHPDHA